MDLLVYQANEINQKGQKTGCLNKFDSGDKKCKYRTSGARGLEWIDSQCRILTQSSAGNGPYKCQIRRCNPMAAAVLEVSVSFWKRLSNVLFLEDPLHGGQMIRYFRYWP